MNAASAVRFAIVLFVTPLAVATSRPESTWTERVESLEHRVDRLYSGVASIGFISGVICAFWAQNTGRNPWVWFFLGFVFSVFALLVLLYKNSQDLDHRRRQAPGGSP